jgi:UDP-3-O-[3-hydroxymyristoyl] glucosamine N-acyltransferase
MVAETIKNNNWDGRPEIVDVDERGFATTRDGGRIGPGVNPQNISPQAIIRGNSLLQGTLMRVHAGAVVDDSYCRDAVVEKEATLRDCVLASTDKKRRHRCDAAGDYTVEGCDVRIASNAEIEHCHAMNSSIGRGSRVTNSSILNSRIGADNHISLASVTLVHSEAGVRIDGPTEVSEAWLARKTCIDQKGYLEGVFSGEFPILDFDETTGRLCVKDTLELPHVSRYGPGVINSTNSGRLLPQPNGIMKDFGPQVALWNDPLLSHEPIRLGPCCWVCPWTKVIGGSSQVYTNAAAGIEDRLHTYLMPFSAAGFVGESTVGMVMPGEQSNGYGHKLRRGCWTFTHAPTAVIQMLTRLYAALEDAEKEKADIVVTASLENALAILKFRACELGLDLSRPRDQQRGSQAKWFCDCRELIEAHLNADIWRFDHGQPVGWTQTDGKWQHDKLDAILDLNLTGDGRLSLVENDLVANPAKTNEYGLDLSNALTPKDLSEMHPVSCQISPAARIHPTAIIDRSATIEPTVTIKENAFIGPGTVLQGKTTIGARVRLFRSRLQNASVGENTTLSRCLIKGTLENPAVIGKDVNLTGCKVVASAVGNRCTGVDAAVTNSTLAPNSRLSMFASLDNVHAAFPTIIGSPMKNCTINTPLMSMHSASCVTGLVAEPVIVEIEGEKAEIGAIPMLGGGCQIRGGAGTDAVTIEGAFIGSNAIIESNCFIGLGSFILGRLGPGEGLLPFTVSHRCGPHADEIGTVLTRFPNIIVTHIIGWTYQAITKDHVHNIVHLVNAAIRNGLNAVQSELSRRRNRLPWDEHADYAKYRSLQHYSEQQLKDGLGVYEEAIQQGKWDMVFDGANLSFANTTGVWAEKNGYIHWQKSDATDT